MKYVEKKGRQPFDWNTFLKARLAGVPCDPKELKVAKARSSTWVSCACGSQCAILGRDENGAPDDTSLFHLGVRFMDVIKAKDWKDAQNVLKQIEDRSAILIQQELKLLHHRRDQAQKELDTASKKLQNAYIQVYGKSKI